MSKQFVISNIDYLQKKLNDFRVECIAERYHIELSPSGDGRLSVTIRTISLN